MKNILHDKPDSSLSGRYKYSAELVRDTDVKGKRVLDVGCGYGWFILHTLSRGVERVSGIEISPTDINTAQVHIKNKKVNLKVGSAIDLPFAANSFDTVVAWDVLEHIPKGTENRMYQEVQRVLKKGGKFYLSTPYSSFISIVFDPAYWLTAHRHYSKLQLNSFGKSNNFVTKKIFIKGKYWNLFETLNMYVAKWIFRRDVFFRKLIGDKVTQEYFKNSAGFLQIFAIYEKQ